MARNITKEQLLQAIEASRGNMAQVRRNLEKILNEKISYMTVQKKIENCNAAKEAFSATKKMSDGELVYRAESGLILAINNNEPWAIKYVLSTLGREFGYDNSTTVKVENSDPLNINLTGDFLTANEIAESDNVEIGNAEEN